MVMMNDDPDDDDNEYDFAGENDEEVMIMRMMVG